MIPKHPLIPNQPQQPRTLKTLIIQWGKYNNAKKQIKHEQAGLSKEKVLKLGKSKQWSIFIYNKHATDHNADEHNGENNGV